MRPAFSSGKVGTVATPDDFTDYDDGPAEEVCGYDWRSHLAADAVALVLAVGSVVGLAWVALTSDRAPF
jgi:hypothetical protein